MNESRPVIARRDPAKVMRLSRLGSLHQCRLSFMRTLTRRMATEGWRFSRPVFEIDNVGIGHAVYTVDTGSSRYSLVAFAHDLPEEQRSDRVIATAWDATFALFDGDPDQADIERLSRNVPFQEAGRVSGSELTLSRANRSARLWEHVVSSLAAGRQPDAEALAGVGYLMRTTAVYGSGKFGAADREQIAERPEMQAPFQAEMLTVYLIRTFVRDLVHHHARVRGGSAAVDLDPTLARGFGIGNSTGLGMAPFIVNHPRLFNNWIAAREDAIARVRSLPTATPDAASQFRDLLNRCVRSVGLWRSDHPVQVRKIAALTDDLDRLISHLKSEDLNFDHPWHRLLNWSEDTLSEEGQELTASLILEPYGDLVDPLTKQMADTHEAHVRIDGSMRIGELRALLEHSFGWALETDWEAPENRSRVWYISAEKLEPRLGERFDEPLDPYEQPLAPARDAAAAYAELKSWNSDCTVAEFLLARPHHRPTVRRAQISRMAPFGEIQDNTISAALMPIDMLRAKLSFFGATHFDPRSDRWVRICMYSGAPYPDELTSDTCDFWVYPPGAA